MGWVLVELVVALALVGVLVRILRRVRDDQDAEVVEHWARNGRDRRPPPWA